MHPRYVALACTVCCVATADAQPREVSRFTIDGGGGSSVGEGYAISGTIGQPDASRPISGDETTLVGGYWPRGRASGCNAADLVRPFGVLDLNDIDGFISSFIDGSTVADVALPFGVIDLDDVDSFIRAFLAGCP